MISFTFALCSSFIVMETIRLGRSSCVCVCVAPICSARLCHMLLCHESCTHKFVRIHSSAISFGPFRSLVCLYRYAKCSAKSDHIHIYAACVCLCALDYFRLFIFRYSFYHREMVNEPDSHYPLSVDRIIIIIEHFQSKDRELFNRFHSHS